MKIVISILLSLMVFRTAFTQYFDNIAPAQGIEHTVATQLQFGGHGVSFFDFDNDGWDDITFVQESDSVVLYKNNNGVFELISSVAFQVGQIRQALWVDYDNDNDYDLFVTSTFGFSRLYENDGNFNFTDVTVAAGISTAVANNFGATFADYDRDGYLDFYLARYRQDGDLNNPAHQNALYRNNGDGTFSDVTALLGVGDSLQPTFMGAWIDVNRNGWPDLYVINDRVLWGNSLYLNNGDGTFTDVTDISGAEMFGEDPMGVTFADYDNDGDIDLIMSNGGPPTKPVRLYTNNGDETFFENGVQMGIWVYETFMCTWGGSWIDVDNNTFLDLYMTTGLLMPATGEARNYLFMSDSAQTFIDSPSLFSGDHIAASYSVAKGDIDNDGYADLVVQTAKNYNSFIWKNNYGPTTGNNYIKITLQGTLSNSMAIGSWITVYCQGNAYSHYTRCGESFISQDSQHHIFGLGTATTVDSIVVEYPSGIADSYYNISVNQSLTIAEGETLTFNILNTSNQTIICDGSELPISAPQFETYLWNTGDTTQTINVSQPGVYFLSAWNEFGHPYSSDTIEVFASGPIYIDQMVTDEICFGGYTGAIELTVFNEGQNFDITWSNGANGVFIDSLTAGSYSYTYLDEFGCSTEGSFEIQAAVAIVLFTEITAQVDSNLGSLSVAVLGGEPPYQIFIDEMSMIENPMALDSGTYLVSVTDAFGCVHEEYVTVPFQSTASWNENSFDAYKVYPNPNSTKLVHCVGFVPDDVVQISDAEGRIISYEKQGQSIQVDPSFVGMAHILISINGKNKMISVVFI